MAAIMTLWRPQKPVTKPNDMSDCNHDECAECHHLIAKNSGQTVEESYNGLYATSIESRIYCDLHKKPYDKIEIFGYNVPRYYRRNEEFSRVNEDGSPYKEPKK